MAMGERSTHKVIGFPVCGQLAGVQQVCQGAVPTAICPATDWPSRLGWPGAWPRPWGQWALDSLHGGARNLHGTLEFVQLFAVKHRALGGVAAHRRHALGVELLAHLGVGQGFGHFG